MREERHRLEHRVIERRAAGGNECVQARPQPSPLCRPGRDDVYRVVEADERHFIVGSQRDLDESLNRGARHLHGIAAKTLARVDHDRHAQGRPLRSEARQCLRTAILLDDEVVLGEVRDEPAVLLAHGDGGRDQSGGGSGARRGRAAGGRSAASRAGRMAHSRASATSAPRAMPARRDRVIWFIVATARSTDSGPELVMPLL